MPTDKQIADLNQTIEDKLRENRTQRSKLNQASEAISSIKMLSRQVEDTPATDAIPAKPAVMNGETEVTPAKPEVAAKPAVMKTVFDVSPKDPMIPTSEMDNTRRQQIFDATKITVDSV